MELSLFLAKLIGLGLTIISSSLLLRRESITLLFDAYKSAAVVYVTGILEVFLGLALILSHNIWTADFRAIITVIGWMMLVRGIGRTFAPERIPQLLGKMRSAESAFIPLLVFVFFVGVYLAYAGLRG